MSEEINISEEARECAERELADVIKFEEMNPDIGYHIQLLLNQRDTKIAALEAEFHNSCEAHGMRVRNLHQIIEERNSALKRLETEVEELRKDLYEYEHALNSTKGEK